MTQEQNNLSDQKVQQALMAAAEKHAIQVMGPEGFKSNRPRAITIMDAFKAGSAYDLAVTASMMREEIEKQVREQTEDDPGKPAEKEQEKQPDQNKEVTPGGIQIIDSATVMEGQRHLFIGEPGIGKPTRRPPVSPKKAAPKKAAKKNAQKGS